jgi:hypothetical protein
MKSSSNARRLRNIDSESDSESDEDVIENYSDVGTSIGNVILYIFYSIIGIFAIYYSFVINKGFNLGSFLLALIFAPIYLIWGVYKVGFPPTIKINRKK